MQILVSIYGKDAGKSGPFEEQFLAQLWSVKKSTNNSFHIYASGLCNVKSWQLGKYMGNAKYRKKKFPYSLISLKMKWLISIHDICN